MKFSLETLNFNLLNTFSHRFGKESSSNWWINDYPSQVTIERLLHHFQQTYLAVIAGFSFNFISSSFARFAGRTSLKVGESTWLATTLQVVAPSLSENLLGGQLLQDFLSTSWVPAPHVLQVVLPRELANRPG
jgi:hypothetical protein